MATFDALAATYDNDFTNSLVGKHLRNRIHQRLLEIWREGNHILELGCGTGEDAHFLGSQGIHVTATDISDDMQQIATEKNQHLNHVTIQPLDLKDLPDRQFQQEFDGVLSNFGALNCLQDWKPLAEWLSARVKSGGTLAFAIMSPFCVWETLWHGSHLDFAVATRRWKTNTTFTSHDSTSIFITYPTVKRLTNDFEPFFQRTRIQPLGLFLPPSDVYPVIEKRKKLLNILTKFDDAFATNSKLALFADHYWIEFERI